MKFFSTIAITLMLAIAAFGQTDDKKAVLAVVNELFTHMRGANAAGILATGTPENQLVGIRKTKEGKTRIDVLTADAFSKFFTKADAVEEVMYDPKVEISGDWAMVWGRYVFFVGHKISHCGINQFNLVRTEAGWKIANGASTMNAADCTEKEKAMKSSLPKPAQK